MFSILGGVKDADRAERIALNVRDDPHSLMDPGLLNMVCQPFLRTYEN